MTEALINTLASPGEFDALTSLRPDEPYFVLVGRDSLAPDLVQQWARARRIRALNEADAETISEADLDLELRKCTQAEAISWAMKSYKAGQQSRAKAESASTRPTYTGHVLPEETQRRDALQSAQIKARSAISAASGALRGIAEALDDFDHITDSGLIRLQMLVVKEIPRLQKLADQVTPKRPI